MPIEEQHLTFSLHEDCSGEQHSVTYDDLLHEVDLMEITNQALMDDYVAAEINYEMNFTKKGNNNTMLSFLFNPNSFFKEFQFISSQPKGRAMILEFEPIDKNSKAQSLSVKVEGTLILQAWLKWKNLGNIEEYTFSDIRFNQNFSPDLFKVAQ